MDVIIYTKKDGGVALGIVCNKAGQLMCDPAAEAARVLEATEEFESARVGTVEDLPGGTAGGRYDRHFFGAFTDAPDGSKVAVDMPKAREIHMGRIRTARDIKLAELDIEQLKGVDVETEKQALRDIPGTFDLEAVKTPAALRKLWPAEL